MDLTDGSGDLVPGYRALAIGAAASGAAPRVLLLHGFTGCAADWSRLGIATPALALDLPGHGGSPAPEAAEHCFDAEVRRLLAALPASIDQVAGYSLGGRLALGLLRLAPRRFRQATILSAHPGLTGTTERARRRDMDQRWIRRLRRDGIEAFVRAWEELPLFATQAGVPPPRLAAQRAWRLAQSPEGLARSLECFGLGQMPPAWDALRAWPGRLRWISGRLDPKFTAIARRVARLRPATELFVLPDAGHNLLLEAPVQTAALIDAVGAAAE